MMVLANTPLTIDEIAKYRSDLNDLLWEFDDYIFPEDFDAEKFAELQSLSRKAAPKIYDILMRMKLESPLSDAASSRGSVPQLLTPTSPPMQGRFLSTSASDFHKGSTGSSLADIHDATAQLRGMMCSPSTTDSSHDHMREPPRPPSMNPWDWEVKPAPPSDSRTPEEVDFDRRAVETESPVLPAASLSGDSHPRLAVAHPPPSSVASGQSDYGGHDEERRLSATSQNTASDRGGYNHHHYNAPSRPRQVTLSQFSIPENEVSEQHGAIPFFKPAATPYSPTQSQHSRQASIPMSVNSDTLSETTHTDLASPSSHDSRGQYGSLGATGFSPVRPPPPPPVQPAPDAASASVLAQMDAGPIPVESEDASKPARPATNQAEECKIGDDSSFHLGKGFCEGAQDVLRGGIGVKRTKKQVGAGHLGASDISANLQIGLCDSEHHCQMPWMFVRT